MRRIKPKQYYVYAGRGKGRGEPGTNRAYVGCSGTAHLSVQTTTTTEDGRHLFGMVSMYATVNCDEMTVAINVTPVGSQPSSGSIRYVVEANDSGKVTFRRDRPSPKYMRLSADDLYDLQPKINKAAQEVYYSMHTHSHNTSERRARYMQAWLKLRDVYEYTVSIIGEAN